MRITKAELDACFKRAGLRRTPQRYGVLQFLLGHDVHATADEIYKAMNRTNPRASRATVYNSLRALIDSGLVKEVSFDGKAARFDAKIHRHHHFVCDQCGSVEDIAWFDLPAGPREMALGGRRVREFEVVFHGTCERCT